MSAICNEHFFSNFFKQHVKPLRNYLIYKYSNSEQAEDVVQESFIKLWQNCKDVPEEKAKSYIYTLANNATLNLINHQKVVLSYEKNNSLIDRVNENPEYLLEQNEFENKLLHILENINETQRIAFLMNRIDGKKYAEIAQELNISVKAVEKRIHLALVEIKQQIKNFK